MSVSVTVVAPADPERAWRRWSDVAAWPEWNPECLGARVEGPPGPGAVLDLRLRHPRGHEFFTRPRVTEAEPGRAFAWEARGMGLRATTRTTFVPEPDGSRIALECGARGPLAFTYRMTMTDATLARLYTRMLDALVEDLRP